MHILVMYYSRTGNTLKLAEAIATGARQVDGVTCDVKETTEVTAEDFLKAGAIIAGSPVYYGTMAAELKMVFDKFVHLREKMENKVGAAFATAGASAGGRETTILSILQAMLINGMIVLGDPLETGGHYGISCAGTPDKDTLTNAEKFGKRVAQVAQKLGCC